MAEYGISTWDANGNYNNYGIKPVSVVGIISLSQGQTSGSWSFTIPSGMKVGFAIALDQGDVGVGRNIVASGNTIKVSPASNVGPGNYAASACELVVFVEKS
ncbi:outer membrane protein [Escherichia phage PGN590]|uniref:Tail fiber protein n=2 Tax=Hanrivervirus TaxID=2560145 RepID=A0A6G8R9V5_9CAUD|nr:outer membrane protein [Salmonella phage slyngel]YP_009902209.1 outer membrane protein [Escherichia phage PGN590]QIN98172.1 hypothetical protein slyngel_29 [Salmonella phage slyngel]QKL16955.1 hypothetical protein [Escherichia phage PGN590]